MPKIIGKSTTVVQFGGLTINELAGNVATKDDTLSIAHVTVTEPASEPWLTLDYDEWICVIKGKIWFYYNNGSSCLEAVAGDCVFVAKGERFKPEFHDGCAEYIPVCIPAFKPERCIREEEGNSSTVSAKLAELHSSSTSSINSLPVPPSSVMCNASSTSSDFLYHMCPKAKWDAAKASGNAYFPETFVTDGYFTHATAVPSRLIVTANHFYQEVSGDWICLRFTRSALLKHGIIVRDEEPKPVGETPVGDDWASWICPHIFGGIPEGVVGTNDEYKIVRDSDGKKFLYIEGI